MKKINRTFYFHPRTCQSSELERVLGGKEPGRQGPMPDPMPKDPPPPPPCPK